LFEGLTYGVTLGLATGVSCLASCGPVYAAYLLGEKRRGMQALWVILLLNAGRFIAYTLFGSLFGALGDSLPATIRTPVAYSGYILFSVYMFTSVIRTSKSCTGCHTGKFLNITKSPFLLGILTGFSICPAFWIALTSAFESSGPLSGMMLFAGFFVGTTVYMLPFALFGLLTTKDWITKGARIIGMIVAVYFGALGIHGLAEYIISEPMDSISVDTDDGHGHESAISIFSVREADTLFVISFPDDPLDRGADLAAYLPGDSFPVIAHLPTDSTAWKTVIDRIPELAPLIAPYWVDSRSEAETSPWQDSLIEKITFSRIRIFAIEYEPYCEDRAIAVKSYLERYSFRVEPDSGFSFLMLNTLGCAPVDCGTCPIAP